MMHGTNLWPGTEMSFLRHGKSIAPMSQGGSTPSGKASASHRHDEFQPAIPWRVALQQSPPPLRRPTLIVQHHSPACKIRWAATSTNRGHFYCGEIGDISIVV